MIVMVVNVAQKILIIMFNGFQQVLIKELLKIDTRRAGLSRVILRYLPVIPF